MQFVKDRKGLDVLEYAGLAGLVLLGGTAVYTIIINNGLAPLANNIKDFLAGLTPSYSAP